ncbi:MAG: 6-bladed beta-propeller [Gemmatimonadales bacterium]
MCVAILLGCAGAGAEPGLAEWQVEHELTIGGADEGPFSFSDIRSFAVADDGTVFLLEAQDHQVRVFSETGEFLRAIGRRGQGPGEFEQPNGLALTADGQLWVYAPGGRRLAQFTAAGEFVQSYLPPINSWGWVWTGGVSDEWRLFDAQFIRVDTASVHRLIATDLRSEAADTLPLPECPATPAGFYAFPRGSMAIPYRSGRLPAVDPRGRVWCVDTREIRVHEYRIGETEPVRTLVAEVLAEPVTAAERDSAIAGVERFKARAGDATVDYSLIPSVKAIVEGISMDDVGRVWVRARTATGFQLIGFGEDGQPLAAVPLPEPPLRWAPLVVRDDRVWYVTTDEDDVPSLVRYRIRR